MRWPRRKMVIGASAAAAVIGLAVSLAIVLPGSTASACLPGGTIPGTFVPRPGGMRIKV